MNKFILNIVRAIFSGLVLFEFLNLVGILKYELDYSWIGLFLTAVGVWVLIELLNYHHNKRVGEVLLPSILIIPLVSLFIDFFGDLLGYYSGFTWYDQFAHFIGGMSTAIVVYYAVKIYLTTKNVEIGRKFMGVFSVFGTAFFASTYEVEEYLETYLLNNNRLGDRMDTPNDLMLTIMGGMLISIGITVYLKYRRK